ncbi:MAG: hypothetical protein N2595_02765 [bacterium]|nr:hypothetical protein [bacterium]
MKVRLSRWSRVILAGAGAAGVVWIMWVMFGGEEGKGVVEESGAGRQGNKVVNEGGARGVWSLMGERAETGMASAGVVTSEVGGVEQKVGLAPVRLGTYRRGEVEPRYEVARGRRMTGRERLRDEEMMGRRELERYGGSDSLPLRVREERTSELVERRRGRGAVLEELK